MKILQKFIFQLTIFLIQELGIGCNIVPVFMYS